MPGSYVWTPERPVKKDVLLEIAGVPIANYTDYTRAIRGLTDRVHQRVEVKWRNQAGQVKSAEALVGYRPPKTYLWSWVWFLQEMVIFAVEARVFWKRPHDDSARLFFWLCVMTVGAYMGGYHWTEIVVEPPDLGVRPVRGVRPGGEPPFLPGLPRINPVFARYRRVVLARSTGFPQPISACSGGACSGRVGWGAMAAVSESSPP